LTLILLEDAELRPRLLLLAETVAVAYSEVLEVAAVLVSELESGPELL